MHFGFLFEKQCQNLSKFPEFIGQSNVIKYFLLTNNTKHLSLARKCHVNPYGTISLRLINLYQLSND